MIAATAATKSAVVNALEGFALTIVFQAVPVYAGAAMLIRLYENAAFTSRNDALVFVIFASSFYGLLVPLLAPRFPRFFRRVYTPSYFDATLSLSDKIVQWRTSEEGARQLVHMVMLLALCGIAMVVWR